MFWPGAACSRQNLKLRPRETRNWTTAPIRMLQYRHCHQRRTQWVAPVPFGVTTTAPPGSGGPCAFPPVTARQGAEPRAHLNTAGAHLHAASMAGPAIGRLRGSPGGRPPCPRRGRGLKGEGRGHGPDLHNGPARARRGEAVSVPGAGSDFESTAAAAEEAGAAAGGLPQNAAAQVLRGPVRAAGRVPAAAGQRQHLARNAAPRCGGGGGGGGSAHAPGLQGCTGAAQRSRSPAQRSSAQAAWEHVTRLQCRRRRRACAVLFSPRGGGRWGAWRGGAPGALPCAAGAPAAARR